MTKEIKIKLVENGKLPELKTEGAAAYDCYAALECPVIIKPYETIRISLGFAVEIPEGYYLEIRGRSGLSSKGIICSTGTIDEDYRGICSAIILNTTTEPFAINNGDRICQMQLKEVLNIDFNVVDELSETKRGAGGFGSTGI